MPNQMSNPMPDNNWMLPQCLMGGDAGMRNGAAAGTGHRPPPMPGPTGPPSTAGSRPGSPPPMPREAELKQPGAYGMMDPQAGATSVGRPRTPPPPPPPRRMESGGAFGHFQPNMPNMPTNYGQYMPQAQPAPGGYNQRPPYMPNYQAPNRGPYR
mmetsp:Transcript_53325/g.115267  ORF Transcript_53325/g.115267 Transcript_53325/m.115267 type:complete len:155 (-) Transcript_53325:32-496(-)